jgi:hypothetical protein
MKLTRKRRRQYKRLLDTYRDLGYTNAEAMACTRTGVWRACNATLVDYFPRRYGQYECIDILPPNLHRSDITSFMRQMLNNVAQQYKVELRDSMSKLGSGIDQAALAWDVIAQGIGPFFQTWDYLSPQLRLLWLVAWEESSWIDPVTEQGGVEG